MNNNPEFSQKNVTAEQDNELVDPTDQDRAELPYEDPEYSADDTEGIARAATGATAVIEEAVKGERRIQSSYTNDGLRGAVEANVSDAHVRAEFADNEVKKVEITLGQGSGEEHPVTILHPESAHPRVMLDGRPVDPREIPAVNDVIDHIKAAAAEEPAVDHDESDREAEQQSFDKDQFDQAA